ncbi:MAG TPA: NYN domain-containing protein [Pseudolysinimonas sp.]|nr:NYN domain-containing protein [Pseudolysinimonas sp.]
MSEPRVAVYIDFDNVVISRYDQIFGGGQFIKDRARVRGVEKPPTEAILQRLEDARVDVGAILDYASSFGSIVVSRAYADWSAAANARYQRQLIDRAVDLTQLFNTAGTKNGADIRLAVDVVEDLFRLEDVTHIVIVAGDSDYIALAQRAKRLGRFVVGIGVAGSTSRALIAACDDFSDYDALPGVVPAKITKKKDPSVEPVATTPPVEGASPPVEPVETKPRRASSPTTETAKPATGSRRASQPVKPLTLDPHNPFSHAEDDDEPTTDAAATDLLIRALQLIDAKNDEEWQTNGEVKGQMLRLDAGFKERPLGFRSFSEFLDSRSDVIDIKPDSTANDRRLRLK